METQMTLEAMIAYQKKFQAGELARIFPKGYDKTALHHYLCSHIMSETQELMDCVPWMLHKPIGRGQLTRKATVVEMIDIFKWLLNVMDLHEVTAEEFYREFCEKSAVVESRIRATKFALSNPGPCLILDMDGVLVDRDTRLLAFINKKVQEGMQEVFTTLSRAKSTMGQRTYEKLKTEFYQGTYFKECVGIAEVCDQVRKPLGIPVVILTARDVKNHPGLHFQTIEWLHKNDIQYDALICMGEKAKALAAWCDERSVFVDDDKHNVDDVANVCHSVIYTHPATVRDAIKKVQDARKQ